MADNKEIHAQGTPVAEAPLLPKQNKKLAYVVM